MTRVLKMLLYVAMPATSVASFGAVPFLPTDDNEVLEVLPRSLYSGRDELTMLRQHLAADPDNAKVAADVASRYLELGKAAGDPRCYGYAQAAIGPWWEAATPPLEILRLRAKLKERDHRYEEAVSDLELLAAHEPHDAQAWIELANIYRVQGQYAKAREACEAVSKFAGAAPTILCRAPVQAVTGQAEEAYASLTEILPTVKDRWPTALQWIRTMQAEIARALGRNDEAEKHYREGLASDPADLYLLRSYADFLLDQGRDEEVLPLLREHTSDTGVLLSAAIAARRCGQEALAEEWKTQLQVRFDESRLRGSEPHGKFEARFQLELMNDPQRALDIAEANWRQQKDLRDSRNVLEAALAANKIARARPVLEFLKESGTQDVILQRLAQELERP
jgi:Tfp pilus assembly protein PilF